MPMADLSARSRCRMCQPRWGRWRRVGPLAWRLARRGAAAVGRICRRGWEAASDRAVRANQPAPAPAAPRCTSPAGWAGGLLVGLLAGLGGAPAWADLWIYVDPEGITHLSEDRLDKRYQRYVPPRPQPVDDLATPDDLPSDAAPQVPTPEQLTFFDISPDYKAVRHHLREAARRYQVDYALLQALVATESRFDAQAVSQRGAVGLMQLMPATAAHYGVKGSGSSSQATKLADPRTNILTGTRHLRYLLDRFPGRVDLAVAAYNAGEGAVRRAGNEVPPYRETQNYVKNVLALYAALKPPPAAPGLTGDRRVRVRLQAEPPVRTASAAQANDLALAERGPEVLAPARRPDPTLLTAP